jgi:hypothetical protein
MILPAILVLVLAAALAGFTYLRLERIGARAWLPMVCRGVAWAALGLLLLNVSCPVAGPPKRPLVLLDASLSMSAAGGQTWPATRPPGWGEVRRFGDERGPDDTLPTRGRLLRSRPGGGNGIDRPVRVVTDGEIEDAPTCRPIFPTGRRPALPRTPRPDLALN